VTPAIALLALLAPADLVYWRAMALARAGDWPAARSALEAGAALAPRDKRFPIELAGVAFKQKQHAAAASSLRRALRLDPADRYAEDFLATLYFLDGNTEAALARWNRIGKPRLERLKLEPEPRLDPQLLGSAFRFAPAQILRLADYRATLERLKLLEVFPAWSLRVEPSETGEGFDATLLTTQLRGWISALRGLPFQTLYPEWRNAGGHGVNVVSLLRWDVQKRRAYLAVSAPIARDAAWRYRLWGDGRNENWNILRLAGFNLKRAAAGFDVTSVHTAWRWTAGAEVSQRRFWNAAFPSGTVLGARAALDRALLDLPERRFRLVSEAGATLARFFGQGVFAQGRAGLEARWLPESRGEDYEMRASLRAGSTAGPAPFDALYMLGLERDNGLWLRGHIGTADGRKGSAPMGRHFALVNWEADKIIRQGGIYTLKAGPFLDGGQVFGPGRFGERGWLWDAGVQLKLRLPAGLGATFIWGRQLRTGHNAFYGL
jgi:tetratricopeptide (TPR) repeat protein